MLKGIDGMMGVSYNAYNNLRIGQAEDSALIKINEQEAVRKQEAQPEEKSAGNIDLRLDDIRPRKNASLEDISLSLNEPNGFEMKGREVDIESLDMQKAISDMQKDQALMQYQYFVGESNIMGSEDGIVIPK